jgi:ABC-type multidrug transport system fused ATPase/permease subunit
MITIDIFTEYIKQNKITFILYICFVFLSYGMESIVLPRLSANLFEHLKNPRSNIEFNKAIYSFVYIAITWMIIQTAMSMTGYIEAVVYPDIWVILRNYILKNILYRYENDYQDLELGKIITELNVIPGNFADFISIFVEYILPRIIVLLMIMVYFFYINWKIGAAYTLGLVLVFFLYKFKLWNCVELSNDRHNYFLEINENVQDKFSNLATIFSSGQIDLEIKENNRLNTKFGQIYNSQMKCTNHLKTYSYIANTLIFVFINSFTLYLYKKGELTSTSVVAIFITILYLMNYLVRLAANVPSFILKLGVLEKTDDFLHKLVDDRVKEEKKKGDIQQHALMSASETQSRITKGEVVFKDVSFGYKKNEMILDGVNLHIYPNTKTCIIGTSGSGKSTLLKLLMKFHEVSKGTIYIDGVDISDMDTNTLRKNISYVNQNTKLFNKSIYENIQYSNPNLTHAQIDQKVQELGIESIFKNIGKDFNASVGIQGGKLSGGQRQVIIILRELLTPSKILILDEPTSAIDEENKKQIYQLIDKIGHEKTVIVITHDMSNLGMYDHVYKMQNKKLVPYSNYQESNYE